MQPATVFLIGDIEHRDFREAVAWLHDHTVLRSFTEFDTALAALGECQPRAMVIAQSRPGQFQQSQIEALHAAAPLSALVNLLGSWCEGELRTGRPLHGMVRVLWHRWTAAAARELLTAESAESRQWSLPRTTTAGERFTAMADGPQPRGDGLVGIHTPHQVNFDGWSDACRSGGYATLWLNQTPARSVRGLAAIVWDAVSCDLESAAELQRIAAVYRDVPIVALLDFVRRQDYDAAIAAGAAAVLAKPFLLADLWWHLQQLADRRSSRASLDSIGRKQT